MKKLLITIFLLFSFSAHAAWDPEVLIGEWENYQYSYSHTYRKLVINNDFTGSYFTLSGKSDGTTLVFTKSDFQFFDGFAVLNVKKEFKIILSAWGPMLSRDHKRILGQLFIYTKENNELKLINSVPITLYSAKDEGFNDFVQKINREQPKNR